MEPLLALALLVCPIAMGAMMWMMARGMMGGKDDGSDDGVEELRAEQARLSAEIERLERERALEPRR